MPHVLKHIYDHLKIYWLIITMVLISLMLYLNWQYSIQRYYDGLAAEAHNIAEKVDDLIENLLQEIYTLPIYDKNKAECDKTVRPILDRISINSPKISGIMITTNNNDLICSDLNQPPHFVINPTQSRMINGPFRSPGFEQPIYIISQKIGTHYIHIVVVPELIEEVLRSKANMPETIILYHESDGKNLIKLTRNQNRTQKQIITDLEHKITSIQHVLLASYRLQSIPEIEVIVREKMSTIIYKLWINQLLFMAFLILVSYGMFILIKKTFMNHYSLRNTLKHALKHHRFYPVYQPIYDQNSQSYAGIEVLLRWNDFNDEVIMPDHFIDEAERTGIIVPITLQIIERAFSETKPILNALSSFHLSFNISALHFTDKHFFENFYHLVERYSIHPKQIILEITERDLLDQNNHIFLSQMKRLIKSGFSLAIDDYGTGHASISYIQHFPFNYLKIDRIFVQAIGTGAINESLIDTIITMAKNLNLQIIAEGVETSEQMDYLVANGVKYLQGWYFAKALNLEALLELLGRGERDEVN